MKLKPPEDKINMDEDVSKKITANDALCLRWDSRLAIDYFL